MISAVLAAEYGISAAEVLPLDLGCDAASTPYRVRDEGGGLYFVKVRAGVSRMPLLCVALFESGIEEVLAPIRSRAGVAWVPVPEGILLVYPWLDGESGFGRALGLEHWKRLGSVLRRVHDSGLGAQLPRETFAVAGVDHLRSQLLDPPPQLASIIEANRSAIELVIERTEWLGEECVRRDRIGVPCHADIHVGNVVTDDSGGLKVIDWDGPRLAPRECDLLFFCDGGTWGGHGKAEEAAFFAGYGEWEVELLLLTYYRYARALEDLVSFGREAVDPSASAEERAEAARWFGVQLEPGQIVDLAGRSWVRLGR